MLSQGFVIVREVIPSLTSKWRNWKLDVKGRVPTVSLINLGGLGTNAFVSG
jgi:hypothetical protein